MDKFIVNIRWKPNVIYKTELPYLPRKGDNLLIFSDPNDKGEVETLVNGKVKSVVYFENLDTRENVFPKFDVYIDNKNEEW